jgi:hypothetical protein
MQNENESKKMWISTSFLIFEKKEDFSTLCRIYIWKNITIYKNK